MVLAFRMTELQNLMVFAGRSKTGRKTDLQVTFPLVQHLFSLSHLNILSLSSTAYKGVPPTPITTRHPGPATPPAPPPPPGQGRRPLQAQHYRHQH